MVRLDSCLARLVYVDTSSFDELRVILGTMKGQKMKILGILCSGIGDAEYDSTLRVIEG